MVALPSGVGHHSHPPASDDRDAPNVNDRTTAADVTLLVRFYERFADQVVSVYRRLDFIITARPGHRPDTQFVTRASVARRAAATPRRRARASAPARGAAQTQASMKWNVVPSARRSPSTSRASKRGSG